MNPLDRLEPIGYGQKPPDSFDDRLAEIQIMIGNALPNSYISLLKRFSGSSIVFNKDVVYQALVPSPWTPNGIGTLDQIYGLTSDRNGIVAKMRTYLGRMPKGAIPIGKDPFGNQICIINDGASAGRIYFWYHDDEREMTGDEMNDFGNMYLISNSFDEFLATLKERQKVSDNSV